MGTMRKTARKNVPGKRYFPGTKRLVEYSRNMAAVAAPTMTSHTHEERYEIGGQGQGGAERQDADEHRGDRGGLLLLRKTCVLGGG